MVQVFYMPDDTMTDAEILKLLRSDDAKERGKGLEALYPGETFALVRGTAAGRFTVESPKKVQAAILFAALVWALQQLGDAMGMGLGLIQDPRKQQSTIVVPPAAGMKVIS
jgi:hypothetical protein